MTPPISVRRPVYNVGERKVLDVFREEYMQTTSPHERKTVAQVKIFPTMFKYWAQIGVDLTAEEMDKRTEVSYIY
jgi:hypothetical protein